jgi:acetyl-CoA C-acetyltransferase
VPIQIPPRGKEKGYEFLQDESIRYDANPETMAKLRPVFKQDGTVTAGNACGMTDGASAMVVMSRARADALGLKPLFSLVAYATEAVDNAYMGIGPTVSIPRALQRAGMTLNDVDFVEINEAFAATSVACEKVLSLDRSKVNAHGGAIALGHPTGCSGVRLLVALYHILKNRNGEIGVASLCGGGGVTAALVIKREN